ncbi:lytic transglycosylase domain-containing protein [Bacteriovorax sp. Seq25_V]|uniref:lytic transglycosylase domain-containing protein n=1 Tax=Bacteriovorax sp. Seq25_V TaxID=1201288 RepID=UPI0012FBEBAA|nr:lytic transglycosylase domain-containing protein [Bacteriovorax sp. Seq25_V]
MKNLTIILMILFMASCSRQGIPPKNPLSELTKLSNPNDDQRNALLILKLKEHDQSRNFKSCPELRELTSDKHPLAPWLLSKYILLCNPEDTFISNISQRLETFPSWSLADLSESIISKSKIPDEIIKAKLTLLDYQKTQKAKIDLLQDAIKIAKKNKLPQEELYKKLEDVSPQYTREVTLENMYDVARDFERNRNFKHARELYRKIVRHKDTSLEDQVKAWERVRMSYKLQRDKETYLKQTQRLVKFLSFKKDNAFGLDKYVEYSITLARIYWTNDQFPKAKARLSRLLKLKELANKHLAQVYFYLGGISEDEDKLETAINFYKKAYTLANDSNEKELASLKDDSLWNISWYYYKEKEYNLSLEWLSKYTEEDSPDYKFYFWKAAILKKVNREDDSQDVIRFLRKADPYGYYGQLSYIYSNELSTLPNSVEKIKYGNDPLSWALYCNLDELAQNILDNDPNTSLSKYYQASYYDKMIFKYFSLSKEKKEDLLRETPLYSFPLAFSDEFINANRSEHVSAPLLMSIARQESAFNPFARSPADAFGLLQLIPAQGERLSKKANIAFKDFNDLYDIEKNISLSSILLEELMKRQNFNFINFVASYNAGENPVHRWRSRNKSLTDIEFIEQIPYSETRNYVKLVTRNYLVYKRLLSKEPFSITDRFFSQGKY